MHHIKNDEEGIIKSDHILGMTNRGYHFWFAFHIAFLASMLAEGRETKRWAAHF
jgi:hypothetical protein